MDAAKKDCILLQAARAFARFGFKKASIDDIAREAGVGKGTVYLTRLGELASVAIARYLPPA